MSDAPRAIILAAGRGVRLAGPEGPPKCLLRFGGTTLLERHLRLLYASGVEDVVVATGYAHEDVDAELDRLDLPRRPEVVVNDRYELGSMLTVATVAPWLVDGADILLMDADVLYDARVLGPLLEPGCPSAVLVDRDFEPGEEPVKVLVRDGVPIELSKRPDLDLPHDTVGESIGFFRLDPGAAAALVEIVLAESAGEGAALSHEEALRAMMRAGRHPFAAVDVTGAPWTEIDFPEDVDRALHAVLPLLDALPVSLEA